MIVKILKINIKAEICKLKLTFTIFTMFLNKLEIRMLEKSKQNLN